MRDFTNADVPAAGRAGYSVAIRHVSEIINDYFADTDPNGIARPIATERQLVAYIWARLPPFSVRPLVDLAGRDDSGLGVVARVALAKFDVGIEQAESSTRLKRALGRLLGHVEGTP